MEKVIVITDFDNTLSTKDFYHILIEQYLPKAATDLYHQVKAAGEKIDVAFLNTIFKWRTYDQKEKDAILNQVTIDSGFAPMLRDLKAKQIPCVILSAGFDYYILHALKREGIEGVTVITNPGSFEGGTFQIHKDETSPFYSPVYGVDKGAVIKHYKTLYEKVIFIGDSEPDFHGAIHADLVFAKSELKAIMLEKQLPFQAFDQFKEIHRALQAYLL